MSSASTLLGAAGEHYVMAELLRRGYIAALAPQGVPVADIVVTDLEGERLCSIQVKTRSGKRSDGGWRMNAKHETMRAERLFYCFVDFGKSPTDPPTVYVVPSERVAEAVSSSHRKWLETPGKNGRLHQDNPVRQFLPDYGNIFGPTDNPFPDGWLRQYRDAWHLLGLDQTCIEVEADI